MRFGRIINGSGYIGLYEYDDQEHEIHYKGSNGFEVWQEWNVKGDIARRILSGGTEELFVYDDKGNMLHCIHTNGDKEWRSNQGTYIKTESVK